MKQEPGGTWPLHITQCSGVEAGEEEKTELFPLSQLLPQAGGACSTSASFRKPWGDPLCAPLLPPPRFILTASPCIEDFWDLAHVIILHLQEHGLGWLSSDAVLAMSLGHLHTLSQDEL